MKKLHPSTLLKSSDEVSQRTMGDETLLVPLRTDPNKEMKILLLNKTASKIWKMLDGTQTLAQIAKAISQQFEVDTDHAQADVISCCTDLINSELIEEINQ